MPTTTTNAKMDPKLAHLLALIRKDHHIHHLKVLYTPKTLRVQDTNGKFTARVVLSDNGSLLVGHGENRDEKTYARPATIDQALRIVYKLSGHH